MLNSCLPVICLAAATKDSKRCLLSRSILDISSGQSIVLEENSCTEEMKLLVDHDILIGQGSSINWVRNKPAIGRKNLRRLQKETVNDVKLSPDSSFLLAVGGNDLAVVPLMHRSEHQVCKYVAPDWICSCSWFSGREFGILCAHGQLVLYKIISSGENYSIECVNHAIKSPHLSSLLYCGLIYVSDMTWTKSVTFNGTAFGVVEVFQCSLSDDGSELELKKQCQLSKHNGVVTSIRYDDKLQILCTSSDDRTIQVWKNKSGNSCWSNFHHLYGFFGHESRVWSSIIVSENEQIYSVGEDSVICCWSLKDGGLVSSMKTNKGSLRCCFFDRLSKSLLCGSDGGTLLEVSTNSLESTATKLLSLLLPKCGGNSAAKKYLKVSNLVASWQGDVTIISSQGEIFWLQRGTKKVVKKDKNLKARSLAYVCAQHEDWCAIGSVEGWLIIMRHGTVQWEFPLLRGKIFGIIWLSKDLIWVSGSNGELHLVDIKGKKAEFFGILPLGNHAWATAGIQIGSNRVLIGDGNGNVCLFSGGGRSRSTPVQTFTKCHGKHGVTDFVIRENDRVVSIGRDGFICDWKQTLKGPETGLLRLIWRRKISSEIDWPAKFVRRKDRILIAGKKRLEPDDRNRRGFRANQFVLYDLDAGYLLCEIACGGGHRSWDCWFESDLSSISLCFVKEGRVLIAKSKLKEMTFLRADMAPKQRINAAICVEVGPENYHVFMASEDTSIVVGKLCCHGDGIEFFQRIDSHISSVTALCRVFNSDIRGTTTAGTESGGHGSFVISGGGRGELFCWEWAKEDNEWILLCDYKLENEPKIISLTASSAYFCSTSSDGFVTLFWLTSRQALEIVKRIGPLNVCPIGVSLLKLDEAGTLGDELPPSVLASTNAGTFVLKRPLESSFIESRVTTSALITICGHYEEYDHQLKTGILKVFCGGECGNVYLSTARISRYSEEIPTFQLLFVVAASYHASAVTQLQFVSNSSHEEEFSESFLSISSDQRVAKWKVDLGTLTLTDSALCDVADPSCFIQAPTGSLAIFGIGFQFWTL